MFENIVKLSFVFLSRTINFTVKGQIMKITFPASKYNLSNFKVKQLDGYISKNFRIDSSKGIFILKVYPDEKSVIDFANAENEIMLYLNRENNHRFPVPVKNNDGSYITFDAEKANHFRLLSYLKGKFLAEAKLSPSLLSSFGKFLAEMDAQLLHCQNYVIEARKHEWDLQYFQYFIPQKAKYIKHPGKRKLVHYFIQQHRENVEPELSSLRKSIIHNDANDRNVLVQNQKVSGIIDFGDMCYSPLINELAIGITYAVMKKENPVEWAKSAIAGYHEILPLQEEEIDLIYWLIGARLCTSVCNSAEEKIHQPQNDYIFISEKPAWQLLEKWARINPLFARNQFREAAGFTTPSEKTEEEVKTNRLKSVSTIFSLSYKKPVYMERAAFQYMFDKYGNSYLDAYNNIPHVGHSHPRVVEAGQKQLAKLNTNTRYLYDNLNEYTANLLSYFPRPLNKVFLVNSGSAATDLALRMVRHFTGRRKVAALEHGYHGNTQAGIEISHYKFSGKGGSGPTKNVLCLPIPDAYRGEFTVNDGTAGNLFAAQAIQQLKNSKEKIAAFIAEPIVGCGGQVPLAANYLKEIYTEIRNQGGLCISDEVQTGFGRLGDVFWGFEQHGVVPDIVILGKPMGNGHPIGAVATTDEIANAFNIGMEFFSSFGGNPVSCAIGQAVLDVIEEEQLQQNAKQVGDYYLQKLSELQQKYECIGDVRGSGLFIGFEFVKNRLTLEPDTELAQKIKNELRNRFILVSTDGPFDNVIKSKPPLCFSKENVDEVISAVDLLLNNKQQVKKNFFL